MSETVTVTALVNGIDGHIAGDEFEMDLQRARGLSGIGHVAMGGSPTPAAEPVQEVFDNGEDFLAALDDDAEDDDAEDDDAEGDAL